VIPTQRERPLALPGPPLGETRSAPTAREPLVRDASPWRAVGWAVLVLVALLGAIYWEILRDLVRQWWDDANYSHGFLVPLFSGLLIWQRRRELAGCAAARPSPWPAAPWAKRA